MIYHSKPMKVMTNEEFATLPAGSVLTFDVESYVNFFLVGFQDIRTGKIMPFEKSEDYDINLELLQLALFRYCIVGFNSRNYDIPMIMLALKGLNTRELHDASTTIIEQSLTPFATEKAYGIKVPRLNHVDLIEVCPLQASLKTYAGRLHCRTMRDLPYDVYQTLEKLERQNLREYWFNDIENTTLVMTELKEQLELRETMSAEYGIDLRSKSDAQIAESVIAHEVTKINNAQPMRVTSTQAENLYGNGIMYKAPAWVQFQTPVLQSALQRVQSASFKLDGLGSPAWPEGLGERVKTKTGWKWELAVAIGNSVYKMGMGGLHSTEKSTCHIAADDEEISDNDVESYYPRIIINERLYPQHMGEGFLMVYEGIVNRRIEAKRTSNKTVADSLKITINGSFGKFGSKYSILYAPDLMLQTTITGQLALLMLIEMMELNGITCISANTDGIVLKYKKANRPLVRQIISMWENHTRFKTEETQYKALYSRDVNNYVAVKLKYDKENKVWLNEIDGHKGKGVFANPWESEKKDIDRFKKNPVTLICTEAVTNFLKDGTELYLTIIKCRDISKFITVRNVKGGAVKDGEYLAKVVRYYYAKDELGTINYKMSGNKVPNTDGAKPIMTFDGSIPVDLDHKRYIDIATEMLYAVGYYKRAATGTLF